MIDRAHAIASRPDVIFTSFGDMLRVPGLARRSARRCESRGADVRVVYSPLDARRASRASNPDRQVVFFGIGFETTAPGQRHGRLPGEAAGRRRTSRCWSRTCSCRRRSRRSCRRPATACRASSGPGHVCAVMGYARVRGALRSATACRSSSPASSRSICSRASCWPCASSRTGAPTVENQYARAVVARRQPRGARPRSSRSSRSATASGAASARSRSRATGSATSTASTTPRSASRSTRSTRSESATCISGLVLRGLKKPSRLPGVRARVHAAAPARRDHGVGRGRLRGLLPVRPLPERRARDDRHEEHADPAQGARERRRRRCASSTQNAEALERCVRRARRARSAPAGACGSWATAARPATRSTSPSSSCTRSSRSGARCPRSALTVDTATLTADRQRQRLLARLRRAARAAGAPARRRARHLDLGRVGQREPGAASARASSGC